MESDYGLSADVVQAQSFTVAFRGYDQAEVRSYLGKIAREMRAWEERAEQLQSAWHAAEERAARPPVLDEDTLMAAVGEETASILRSARAAAADMRAKAASEAERLLAEASERAAALTNEAGSALERATAEAQSAAEQILSSAQTEAEATLGTARSDSAALMDAAREEATELLERARAEVTEVLGRARAEADAIRSQADKERALTIDGANATRDRILEDLSRRRRIATVQIEQLRAGRERLIESYALVRRTLEEATAELGRADAEARAAADEVGRRLAGVAEPRLSEDAHVEERPSAVDERPSPVDELFARIRGAGPTDGVTVDLEEPADDASARDEELLQRREAALGSLEVAMVRKLKRTLQDEQNDLLDRLRGMKGGVKAEDLMGDEASQLSRYARAAGPSLEAAYRAGGEFTGLSAPEADPDGIAGLGDEAAGALVGGLRRRLLEVVAAHAGDEQASLVEALGAAYREWKTQRVERVVADVLSAAFTRGVWDAVPEGALLRWVVEDADGPCADCDDDALAGWVAKGEAFPTGQHFPPAHSGCRCLLVAESADTSGRVDTLAVPARR